jgi:hypothetical protein
MPDPDTNYDYSAYAPLGGDPAWLADYLKQKGVGLAEGLAGTVMAPGQAAQSTTPINTAEMIKPAADLALGMVGTPGGAGGLGAGARLRAAPPTTVAETAAASTQPFFDYSRLNRLPDVPQIDLPRYAPPRGVPERVSELVTNPDVRAQMVDLINQGKQSGAANWYNTDPLRQSFVEELGARKGAPAFQQYMDMVAATSPRSKVPENVRNASYYYGLARRGEAMPEVGTPNPAPYGHLAQKLHQANAGAVATEGWNPLQNPKPASFAQNLSGNFAPVTVDTHAFGLPAMLARDPRFLARATLMEKGAPTINPTEMFKSGELTMPQALERPAFWASKPQKTEYGAMENYYKDLARETGLQPAQAQAAAWSAGGNITGLQSEANKPFIGFVEDRLRKTADARGISVAEALSQMIRGKAPLLSAGGAAALPLLRREDQQQGGL